MPLKEVILNTSPTFGLEFYFNTLVIDDKTYLIEDLENFDWKEAKKICIET